MVFQYEKTAKELELKRNEVVNLTKEYEQKVRLKEVRCDILFKNIIILTWLQTQDLKHETRKSCDISTFYQSLLIITQTRELIVNMRSFSKLSWKSII